MESVATQDSHCFDPRSIQQEHQNADLAGLDCVLDDTASRVPYATGAWNPASCTGASTGSSQEHQLFDEYCRGFDASWLAPTDLAPSLESQLPYWADGFDLSQAHPSPPNPASYSAEAHQLTTSPPSTNEAIRDNHAASTANRFPRTVKRLRRQNHACDPCRASKKACDLARGAAIRNGKVAVPCSSCTARDIDCTASWLWSKQHQRKTCRDAEVPTIACQTPKPTGTVTNDGLASVSRLESSLCRTTMANRISSQFFNLYVDMADTCLSQCVLRGSMPLQYKLGVAAYDNLSTHSILATCVQTVEQWVASCWQETTAGQKPLPLNPGPHVFRVVCLLDAFFSASASGSARDAALTEAFKWVAIATAAQVNRHDDNEQVGRSDGTRARKHDIALVSWQNAKKMVFTNIAATQSFRLALSLMLFGNISPPVRSEMSQPCQEDAEDREFGFCEGIRRLRELCSQARQVLLNRKDATRNRAKTGFMSGEHLGNMPDEICHLISELLGAVEWLVGMYNAVAIGASRGKLHAISPYMEDENLEQQEVSPFNLRGVDSTMEMKDDLSRSLSYQEMEAPLLKRAREESVSFIDIWRSNIHKNNDALIQAGRLSAALSAISWKFLARYRLAVDAVKIKDQKHLYDAVRCRYSAMTSLIALWRTTFGTIDSATKSHLQSSHREVWRTFAFCAIDTGLSILLFYDTTKMLEDHLQQLPSGLGATDLLKILHSTRAFRTDQRLVSAKEIAAVSSTCQDGRNLSREQPTYQGYMCAHPVRLTHFPILSLYPIL